MRKIIKWATAGILSAALSFTTTADINTELTGDFVSREFGQGPYETLILANVYMIDGRGGPTRGPMNIHVNGNRISKITRAAPKPADLGNTARYIDLNGHFILPGFINTHGHLHSITAGEQGWGPAVSAEYISKLWLAHGITSVRELGNGRGTRWTKAVSDAAANNDITAPRIFPYVMFNQKSLNTYADTPKEARQVIRRAKKDGMIGVKFLGAPRAQLEAAIDEAKKLGMKTTMHHAQTSVVASNVMTTSEIGLDSMEHWYGLPEALFHDRAIQDYPANYIYEDEQDRFTEAGKLWQQAAPKGHPKYEQVMTTLLNRGFKLSPTFSIYVANRDWMRARNADWHKDYTLPYLWDWYRPSKTAHGSYWYDWTQDRELAWKENFRIWMGFVNEYKNRGGIVTVGEDAGYIYSTYGFGYIQELEMLREAGFHPLEVIRAATLMGARMLDQEKDLGTIEVGKLADFVITSQNPLHNFKTLYSSGHIQMDRKTGAVEQVSGIQYTVKDGIIYNANKLRADIRNMVQMEKEKLGLPAGALPVTTK